MNRRFFAPLLPMLVILCAIAVPPGTEDGLESSKHAITYPTSSDLYHILYRGTSLDDISRPVRMKLGSEAAFDTMRDTVPRSREAYYRVLSLPIEESRDTDADGLTDIEELHLSETQHPLNPAIVAEAHGAAVVNSREQFERMARRDSVPGASNIREMKFLITEIDTEHPKLHLVNTQRHEYHYYFYFFGLNRRNVSLATFNSQTYFTNTKRKNLAGSLLAHDNYTAPDGRAGIYTMEFWPTDPVAFRFVETAYEMLSASLPFINGNLAYHPAGETQRGIYDEEQEAFEKSIIRTITTEELFGNKAFEALNPGTGLGRLVIADGSNVSLTARDVVIFRNLPNDLTHVAGILTEVPQTPLSHVNLKAKQNDTPNAYLKDASRLPEVEALLGKYVTFEVTSDGYTLEEATAEQVEKFIESIRPKEPHSPARNLAVEMIAPLGEIAFSQSDTFGAKAANLSELRRILPSDMTPEGYAIPFSFYHHFMLANGFYDYLDRLLNIQGFDQDPDLREAELKKFRDRLRKAPVPSDLSEALSTLQEQFPEGTAIRCRSSTNNEDLPGFNGAGLYDSYTHYPHEGALEKTIKQVWASMWNYRAFEERSFYRIQHDQAAMGVLVHPSSQNETANGVAVTRNIIDPNWIGYYVNVQVGEDLVTNPSQDAIPEEFLVSLLLADPEIGNYEYEVQYVRKSNRRIDGQPILTQDEIFDLAGRLRLIQTHFKRLYRGGTDFGMEIEFKIDANHDLLIKQARPWID